MEKSSRQPGADRISFLPDDVIHSILSPYNFDDVLHLGVLSKQWNAIWKTIPYLHFDIDRYGCDIRMAHKFKDFINWVFNSQCTTRLVRFKLFCGNMFDSMTIFRWICLTTRRNVQEIVLSFRLDEPFQLPYCVATSESVQVLKLRLFGANLKLPNHLGFRRLKFLHLVEVELSDEHLTNCLFSKPLLETLILRDCTLGNMAVLHIASSSLVNVLIKHDDYARGESYGDCIVKISCPNLKVLKYSAPIAKDIIIENVSSIEVVHIFPYEGSGLTGEIGSFVHKMIKNAPSTSVLKLSMMCLWGLFSIPHELKNSPVTFYKLKTLKLSARDFEVSMQVMILLLKHSPKLEVLTLFYENIDWDEDWELEDPSENIVCLESHLKLFQLTGFKHEENEIELLRFFLKNARVLEKMMVVWSDSCVCDVNFAQKSKETAEVVLKYPRTSPHVVVTFLDVNPKPKHSSRYSIV